MTALTNPTEFKMSGQLKLTSNGDGAKSVKVSVTARSGDPIDHPYWGMMVHDFSGMTNKARIPLDSEHCEPIGYLSNFDTSTGELVCSGAIVIADEDIQTIVTLMSNGVPYEASIAHSMGSETLLEFIPEGFTVNVNNRDLIGPLTIVRKWELDAVAVCKLGADDATSTVLLSNNKSQEKQKGFFMKISKTHKGNQMSQEIEKKGEADVKAVAVETPGEIAKAVVESEVKAEDTQLSAVAVETVKVVEAVAEVELAKVIETAKAEEVVALSKPVEAKTEAAPAVELAKSNPADPRAEFKRFVAEFGAEKAVNYFAEGKSFSEAFASFAGDIKAENAELKKRLAAIDRGAEKPVAFSDAIKREELSAKPQGMASVIRRAAPVKK